MRGSNGRDIGFDFLRAFAVFAVYICHIFNGQIKSPTLLLLCHVISPGITMSALGFMSGFLLSQRYNTFGDNFYIRRFLRIYTSLIICLTVIAAFHLCMGYHVMTQHTILHFMGLSLFIGLVGMENKSSLGGGLWFITVILGMYVLLPLMRRLYSHRNRKVHIAGTIILCLLLNTFMYGAQSSFNVIISFNLGCYLALNKKDFLSKKDIFFHVLGTALILILCGYLTVFKAWKLRDLLFPLYPVVVIPLLYRIGSCIRGALSKVVAWCSSISYEVYIVHFYFINRNLIDLFPCINSPLIHILTSFAIVIPLAYLLSTAAAKAQGFINAYLLG